MTTMEFGKSIFAMHFPAQPLERGDKNYYTNKKYKES